MVFATSAWSQPQRPGKCVAELKQQQASDNSGLKFPCNGCSSVFSRKCNLYYHRKYECGQPPRFQCPYCQYRTKHQSNVRAHVRRIHAGKEVYFIDIGRQIFDTHF